MNRENKIVVNLWSVLIVAVCILFLCMEFVVNYLRISDTKFYTNIPLSFIKFFDIGNFLLTLFVMFYFYFAWIRHLGEAEIKVIETTDKALGNK